MLKQYSNVQLKHHVWVLRMEDRIFFPAQDSPRQH